VGLQQNQDFYPVLPEWKIIELEYFRLVETSAGLLVCPSAQRKSSLKIGSSFWGPCSNKFSIYPKMEIPQPLYETCASA